VLSVRCEFDDLEEPLNLTLYRLIQEGLRTSRRIYLQRGEGNGPR
jgi:hypothetical protein